MHHHNQYSKLATAIDQSHARSTGDPRQSNLTPPSPPIPTTPPSPPSPPPLNQKPPLLPIPLPLHNPHNRPNRHLHPPRPIPHPRQRRKITLRKPRTKAKTPKPQLPILPLHAHTKHIQRSLRNPVLHHILIVDRGLFIGEARADGSRAGGDVYDSRAEGGGGEREERGEGLGDEHGADGVGVETCVH